MVTALILINFLVILSFLVLIHELAHFLVARKAGVKVEEFGLGLPPRAKILLKDKLGTIYSLNWLPIGGFVRMSGEDEAEDIKSPSSPPADRLYAKSKRVRLAIIVAGTIANFLVGVILFGGLYTYTGIPEPLGYVKVDEVIADTPAMTAGLQAGDKIIAADDTKFPTADAFTDFVGKNRGRKIILTIERHATNRQLEVYVRSETETPPGQGPTGIFVTDTQIVKHPWWQMPFRGMAEGIKISLNFIVGVVVGLGNALRNLLFAGTVPKDIAGPVGIGYQAVKHDLITPGMFSVKNLLFTAIISLNLAIINLLPFPALDGGRALLVILEKLTSRRLRPQLEHWLNLASLGLLLTLFLLISANDIGVIVNDSSVRDWLKAIFGR